MVRIALTGTPGVGKTTVARLLREAGWRVEAVHDVALGLGCIVGHDLQDGSDVIDVEALSKRLPPDGDVVYEGHLAHLLGVEEAWVIRCDPAVLQGRLEARGYSAAKITENLEAEAMDLVLQEALDQVPRVVQRDGTRRSPRETMQAFVETQGKPFKKRDLEGVDWSHWLP